MTDESHDRPVLSGADRALLSRELSPTDAQLEATRRALGARIAALAAGAAITGAAGTAQATSGASAAAAAHGVATGAAVKWISAGLIVTAVASGAVVATRREPPAQRAPAVASAQPAVAPKTASRVPPAVLAAEPSAAPVEAPLPERAAVDARPAATKPALRRAAAAKPARALEGETLAAELALLHGARQALARHDASGALAALDAHAARFPNAVLRQEALSARALALCEAGRVAEARRAAAQLARLAPRSPHLIRLADSCALPDASDE